MVAESRPLIEPRRLDEAEAARLAVDGVAPRMFVAPRDADEVARTLAWASNERHAVLPRGGGTRQALGNVPRAADLVVSLDRLDAILDYEPADLTITVQAGVPFTALQAALKERGQFLPLDPAGAEGTTIGGIVATNASGPLRLRYGSARDLVIGTRVATLRGEIARSGGKVVKNVTGYDLNKLYVGSFGTLGLIVELTFKVQPLPAAEATIVAQFPDRAAAQRAIYRVVRSPLVSSALEIASVDDTIALYAHVGAFEKPLARTIDDISRLSREEGASSVDTLDATAAAQAWLALRAGPATGKGGARLKIAVPIDEVVWACDAVEAAARAHNLRSSLQASAGVGVLYASLDTDNPEDSDALVAAIRRLRAQVREHLGSVVVESCPLAVKREVDVFGDLPDNFDVMRRLKQQLDPAGILNPGRFLGRL